MPDSWCARRNILDIPEFNDVMSVPRRNYNCEPEAAATKLDLGERVLRLSVSQPDRDLNMARQQSTWALGGRERKVTRCTRVSSN
jgi:hypothetical protein